MNEAVRHDSSILQIHSKNNSETSRYVIGDVHGRSFWKSCVKALKFSEFYIMGDYFDNEGIPFHRQYANFISICKAARSDNRIKLCLGNHDFHYLKGVFGQRYSGFQARYSEEIGDILEENMDLFKIVYVTKDNYIISHAGITSWFYKSLHCNKPEDINIAFNDDRNILRFNGSNIYGDDITQSPIWVRPGALQKDPLPGYTQIVGHTLVDEIIEVNIKNVGKLVILDTGDNKRIYRF